MFDLVIEGGTVVDGTGRERFRADVGIEDGKITAVGSLSGESATARIDAHGLVVAPGFIDSHSHADISLLAKPSAEAKSLQGVTTEIIGNCGFSTYPLMPHTQEQVKRYSEPLFGNPEIDWTWNDLTGYAERYGITGAAVNAAALIGHGALRSAVMGHENRVPTATEIDEMKSLAGMLMAQGAVGMSTGLAYVPGVYAGIDEIAAVCEVVGAHGGLYATHLRDQADHLVESVEEALAVGRRAKIPVLISHHKAAGPRNYGKVKTTLSLLDAARGEGIPTYADLYPYTSGMSTMNATVPPWMFEGGLAEALKRLADPQARAQVGRDLESGLPGWENRLGALGWDNIVIATVVTPANKDLEGLSLAQGAQKRGKPNLDFLLDLLLEEQCNVGRITHNSCEEDLVCVMCHGHTMVGSDGIDAGKPHPRQYGTFPRVIADLARERGVMTLEAAVRKMTGLTAETFRLHDIGIVAPGRRADLVLFDPLRIRDTATYADPCQYPEGIAAVMVNGVWTAKDGRSTGALPGSLLRPLQP